MYLLNFSGIDTHIEKSVITYHKLPLEIPTQVQYHCILIIPINNILHHITIKNIKIPSRFGLLKNYLLPNSWCTQMIVEMNLLN